MHTVELRLRTADGRVRLVESVCQNLLTDADVGGLVWNGRDVTDRRALEDRLSHQASHDPLTGLPNRTLLINRLETALAGRPHGRPAGGGDPDRSRRVQERQRHAGPRGRRRAAAGRGPAAARLRAQGRHRGPAGRRRVRGAGRRWSSAEQAVVAGQRIVDVLRQPFTLAGQEVRISASIGIAYNTRRPAPPRSCCATPTSRCTWPRTPARAGWRSSSRACGPGRPTGSACSRTWPGPWTSARSRCTSSRSST